jgi:hypothetical protein
MTKDIEIMNILKAKVWDLTKEVKSLEQRRLKQNNTTIIDVRICETNFAIDLLNKIITQWEG